MANNVSNVSILRPDSNGVLWYAPLGTPVPTDIDAPLDPAFKTCGYISSDGIEKSDNFEEGESKQAYGGDTVVQGTPKMNPSVKFTVWETGNPDAMALVYNKNDVSGSANNLTVKITEKVPDDCVMVFKFARSNTVKQVDVHPHAVFGSRGDATRDDENPDGYEVTYNFRKDANGAYGYSSTGEV